MAYRRMALEIGMGTDIRGADHTKAAVRALRDALWHNSLTITHALGVPRPDLVDKAAVLAVLPHGTGAVTVVEGGLEIANEAGTDSTVIANAAAGVVVHTARIRTSDLRVNDRFAISDPLGRKLDEAAMARVRNALAGKKGARKAPAAAH